MPYQIKLENISDPSDGSTLVQTTDTELISLWEWPGFDGTGLEDGLFSWSGHIVAFAPASNQLGQWFVMGHHLVIAGVMQGTGVMTILGSFGDLIALAGGPAADADASPVRGILSIGGAASLPIDWYFFGDGQHT